MIISVDSQDPRPIYTQIVDEVRRALLLGVLNADDPLPSVRQLAVTLRVNPNTVVQAYRELERLGLVYVRRGEGTFACRLALTRQERQALAEGVATRAVQDAHHNGLTAKELIDAVRMLPDSIPPEVVT